MSSVAGRRMRAGALEKCPEKVFHSTHLARCTGNGAHGKGTPRPELHSDGSFNVGKRTVEMKFIFSTSVGLNPASQMLLLVISKCV